MSRTATSDPLTILGGLGDPSPYLLPDERLVVAVRRHVMVLAAAFVETIGFILGAWMIQLLVSRIAVVHTITMLIMLAAVVRFCYLILEWRLERCVITDQRMMLVGGVLTRQVAVMPMRKVTDLTFEKPLIGQIFGYGTFIVESAGQDQALSRIEFLPQANRLYRRVSDLLFGNPGTQLDPGAFDMPPATRTRYDEDDILPSDRELTDPDLGTKLAGVDFDALPQMYPARDRDHPALFDALHEHESASRRMRERLGGLSGRGRHRDDQRQA